YSRGVGDARSILQVIAEIAVQDLAAPVLQALQELVPEDREQPGPAVGAGIEPGEAAKGAQAGLLDEILGLRPVVGEPERAPIERIEVDKRRFLELPGAIAWLDPLEHSVSPTMLNPFPRGNIPPAPAPGVAPGIASWFRELPRWS